MQRRPMHRSTREERARGLVLAVRLIIADAFYSTKDHPCRKADARDAVAQALGFSQAEKDAFADRWSQWLRGLPQSAGRLRPNEARALSHWIMHRGLLPEDVLAHLAEIIPDVTFRALCSTLETTAEELTNIKRIFCAGENAYQVFRYTIGEPGRIAVGGLTIKNDATTRAVVTHERYYVKRQHEHYRGYLVKQKDGVFGIYSKHQETNEIQLIQCRSMRVYGAHTVDDLGGKMKMMAGTFLDRHDQGFLYTGKIVIRRNDSQNRRLLIKTMSEHELREYDLAIYNELKMKKEEDFPNLFTFRV